MLEHAREAVLLFQNTVTTRPDLGMLASVHNEFVRIATFRMRASLLEFLGELSGAAEAARTAASAPARLVAGAVVMPTRPTRLARIRRTNLTWTLRHFEVLHLSGKR